MHEKTHGLMQYIPSIKFGAFEPVSAYNFVARQYDQSPWRKFWDRNELPIMESRVKAYAGCSSALDIGCGTGRYAEVLTKYCKSVEAIDPSSEMLNISIKRNPTVLHHNVDIEGFFPNRKFDIITVARVLSHSNDQKRQLGIILDRCAHNDTLLLISDLHYLHRYDSTAFEVDGIKIRLNTYKYRPEDLTAAFPSMSWDLKTYCYANLRWKPGPMRFSTVSPHSRSPIFFTLFGRGRSLQNF